MNVTTAFLAFPALGALIGYSTNWLAVKMIFRPRTPRKILGFTVEGVIPRRRRDLARSVAETVERDLLSVETIQEVVLELVEGEKMRTLLRDRIHSLIQEQVEKLGPMIKAFLPGDLIPKLESRLEEEVIKFIRSMSEEVHHGIEEHLNVREMVQERIEGFDLVKLEEIVFRIAEKELRHIEILGAVLGGLIGVAQASLVAFLG